MLTEIIGFMQFTAPMEYASDPIKHYASQIDLSVATDFARAAHYAFFSEQMIILYSVGNLLYAYDYNRHDLQVIDIGSRKSRILPWNISLPCLQVILLLLLMTILKKVSLENIP